MLCSEILNLHLQPRHGRERRERKLKANLEEIWSSGALLLTDSRIHRSTSLWFEGGGRKFYGEVIAGTLFRGLGYFVEIRFRPDCTWSERNYRPQHLFNPLVLLANRIFEATLQPSKSSFASGRTVALARTAAASWKQAY
jgi:hypothetical protein